MRRSLALAIALVMLSCAIGCGGGEDTVLDVPSVIEDITGETRLDEVIDVAGGSMELTDVDVLTAIPTANALLELSFGAEEDDIPLCNIGKGASYVILKIEHSTRVFILISQNISFRIGIFIHSRMPVKVIGG